MCEKKIKILTPIIKTCGEKAQMVVAIEEASELQKALCKYLRVEGAGQKFDALKAITEEMADVQIMLDQLMIIFANEEQMQKVVAEKIERTYKRLGIETKEG